MKNKRFVMSYSFGKDSTLALHKTIENGGIPIALLVMVNEQMQRSFFHGIDHEMMNAVSESLQIPLIKCTAGKDNYNEIMESGLRKAKAMGADSAVFGDIDISDHKTWCTARCKSAGIDACFPLWQIERENIVNEVLYRNYTCLIKSVNNKKLPKEILGMPITKDMTQIFKKHNADVCGEYGEYHTFVVNAGLFKTPIPYKIGKQLDFGDTSVIDIHL